MSKRYAKSEEMLARALKTIPLGSQTFSKSKTQYPYGVSPYFVNRGKGSRVWDVDGHEYIDFANSLCSVNLGYCDPDVAKAVQCQLEDGVIFTLSHPLEIRVAELVVEMVPSAEMVRFGKNGSDATAGAVRLARAFTGRDRVAVCGYHGWQDWYIGSTARNRGVPKSVRDLTHTFTYNNLPSLDELLKKFPGEFAAVIMEPMNTQEPIPGFLQAVKDLAHKHGALLVFDEVITGFRFANGGAQELFGVTPDLTTLGKGIANGFPLSAVAGRADIMRLMEEIFFSFTFGGETLSLAAAEATLTKLKNFPVTRQMSERGASLKASVHRQIESHQISNILSISGHPSWTFLHFKDAGNYTSWQIKTLFLQELFARGILSVGTHNMSYSHSQKDIEALAEAYDEIFPLLGTAVRENKLESLLNCAPLEPLFKLR